MAKFFEEIVNLAIKEIESKQWNYINYNTIIKSATFDNPISIFLNKNLSEGLIHTFPVDKTINYIKSYFDFSDGQIMKKQNYDGSYHIIVYIPNIEDNVEIVKKAFSLCGYHLGYTRPLGLSDDTWFLLQFEQSIKDDCTEELKQKETTVTHLTPYYNVNKIRHIGITPRSKNNIFKYPDRIYLLYGSLSQNDINILGYQLNKQNNNEHNNGKYALLTIDLSKLPNHIKFYKDSNYKYGVYTNNNIPPNAITNITELYF